MEIHRCPKCSKKFSRLSSVSRHLSQRNSACARLPRTPRVPFQYLPRVSNNAEPGDRHGSLPRSAEGMDVDAVDGYRELENDEPSIHVEDIRDNSTHNPPDDGMNRVDLGHDSSVGLMQPYIDYFPEAAQTYGKGETFLDAFDKDEYAVQRQSNLYYPFCSRNDWEVGSCLHGSGLSMSGIDDFLKLTLIKQLPISFRNSKDLRARIEMLPKGPEWIAKPLSLQYPTKTPVSLYYRDAKKCLECLMTNPLVADHIEFKPFRIYADAEKKTRMYTEWLSGDTAWNMQLKLPVGASLLGVILSSDKTCISVMTGSRMAYPLLISLANINQNYRLKNSHNTFMLLALLPVAKFIHKDKRLCSLLHDRMIHSCLDLVLQPLKAAAVSGCMLSDPLGNRLRCYPMLASYTVDTPEAQLLACVGAKTSPVTMSYYKQFGDPFRHAPRTSLETLRELQICKAIVSPDDLGRFLKEAQNFRLNGVDAPFWRDWRMAEPCLFLTPEPLHHWHKQFWDHDVKWCINIVGPQLIDFFFSLLHYRTGYRQFREGISALKQVTGRTQRDIERYIIAVIGLVAPWNIVFPIRCLMDFRYFGQSPAPTNDILSKMLTSLRNFHLFKDSIIAAGGRRGSHNNIITNWHITKLELYQSVVSNIIANGSAMQYTADITEHCHVTEIKEPARAGNNQNYDDQIVRALDRDHKRRFFDLATSIREAHIDFRAESDSEDSDEGEVTRVQESSTLLASINPVSRNLFGAKRKVQNYFKKAELVLQGTYYSRAPVLPLRTFVHDSVAFNLSRDPNSRRMTIDQVMEQYALPDLCAALREYINHVTLHGDNPCRIGGRRSASGSVALPDYLQVWHRMRIQSKAFNYPHDVLEKETANCQPPSTKWPSGLYDAVLVNTDSAHKWPKSKLEGHTVAELRLIFRIATPQQSDLPNGLEGFLCYVQRFDIVPQYQSDGQPLGFVPNPVTGMYVLRRSLRSDGSRQGGIVQVRHIRTVFSLVPCFRKEIDHRLNKNNCMDYYSEFWLNDYFDKETFWTLRS